MTANRKEQTYDPLRCIPPADVIRKRLALAEQTANRLRILLKTAEEIERVEPVEEIEASVKIPERKAKA